MEQAMFAAGCFWGVEEAFRKLPGVSKTSVGYAGGDVPAPTYERVCNGDTGHAETVQVEFDPAKVSYDQLLDVFFANHDPTQVNRQGPDVGEQYRSAIFPRTPAQEAAAIAAKERLEKSGKFRRPIATRIEHANDFWKAEDYHQQYFEKRGRTHG
jgi:peptide-methionine (S)-S-oxide reductase